LWLHRGPAVFRIKSWFWLAFFADISWRLEPPWCLELRYEDTGLLRKVRICG
jgi:hypothetical protein